MKILKNPWGIEHVHTQVNIQKLISAEQYDLLDEEIQNHNFDIVCVRRNLPNLVVEVNYKHGEKAARKWREIFCPLLVMAGLECVTIDDYDCTSLFKPHTKVSFKDIQDVANQMKKVEVTLG